MRLAWGSQWIWYNWLSYVPQLGIPLAVFPENRKNSYGVGVERTFPVHAPLVDKIEVVRKGKVRRAKLNYIRKLSAKAARIKERR